MVVRLRPGAGGPGTAGVEAVAAAIEELNRSTEADFLTLGEKLGKFLSAARQILSRIEAAAELVSGGQAEAACASLARVLQLAESTRGRCEATATTLSEVRAQTVQLRSALGGYDSLVMSFRVTATLARIETTRLGGAQSALGDLADQVVLHGEQIRTRVESAVRKAAEVERQIESALENAAELGARQTRELPCLVSAVEKNLEAFIAQRARAATAVGALRLQFGRLTQGLNDVVMAIQVHDITRQQLEHVMEALTALSRTAGAGRRQLAGSDAAVVKLQRMQLAAADGSFMKACGEIRRSLDAIAGSAREMEAARAGLRGENSGGDGLFGEIERSFGAILEGLSRSRDLEAARQARAAESVNDVEQLRGTVDEIRGIEFEMRRLSLNAGIRAIHVGEAGEPLTVIANAMNVLARQSAERSDATGAAVSAMQNALMSIEQEARTTDSSSSEPDVDLLSDLRSRLDDLRRSSERCDGHNEAVSDSVAALCMEVMTAGQDFSIGDHFHRRRWSAATGSRASRSSWRAAAPGPRPNWRMD
jgi:hypothetical protein